MGFNSGVKGLKHTELTNAFLIQCLSTGNTILCGGKYVPCEVRVQRVCFKRYSFTLQHKDDIFWSSKMYRFCLNKTNGGYETWFVYNIGGYNRTVRNTVMILRFEN